MNEVPARQSFPSLQRVSALGRISVVRRHGGTRLGNLFQEGAAKIRLPAREGEPLEAILINTAGGLTGGDRVTWEVDAAEETSIALTTQACEKVYRAAYGHAEVICRLTAGAGARIAWLPQETIVFNNSSFRRRLDVDLAADAEALIVEAAVFGRRAMGESVAVAEFADRWRVRCDGRLVHAEDFRIGPDVADQLRRAAVAGGAAAVATVLVVAPDADQKLDDARAVIGEGGGVSTWQVAGTGKLLARIIAGDGYTLRSRLIPLVELLNGRAGLPKTWSL